MEGGWKAYIPAIPRYRIKSTIFVSQWRCRFSPLTRQILFTQRKFPPEGRARRVGALTAVCACALLIAGHSLSSAYAYSCRQKYTRKVVKIDTKGPSLTLVTWPTCAPLVKVYRFPSRGGPPPTMLVWRTKWKTTRVFISFYHFQHSVDIVVSCGFFIREFFIRYKLYYILWRESFFLSHVLWYERFRMGMLQQS